MKFDSCSLLSPKFSPKSNTAFSLKKGDFTGSDVTELLRKVEKAKKSENPILNKINGSVMVTNFIKTENDIDKLILEDVYCWDGRRLIFYSAKAKGIMELAPKGPIKEFNIISMKNCSYIIQTEASENLILAKILIFYDSHSESTILTTDHLEQMLTNIYKESLKPIAESSRLVVKTFF